MSNLILLEPALTVKMRVPSPSTAANAFTVKTANSNIHDFMIAESISGDCHIATIRFRIPSRDDTVATWRRALLLPAPTLILKAFRGNA